jgi:hypothetical protein
LRPLYRGQRLGALGKRLMRVDIRPAKRNAPRPAWKVAKAYHQWLRGRPCFVAGGDCWGRMEAAHTPDPKSKGVGTKAADYNAIPLCQLHHQIHTNQGWSAIGLTRETAQAAAARYWALWQGDKGELK